MLHKRAVFDSRICAVFVPCHESAVYGSHLCVVTTPYLHHMIKMSKIHDSLPYNGRQLIALVEIYLPLSSFLNHNFLFKLTSRTTTMVSIILKI